MILEVLSSVHRTVMRGKQLASADVSHSAATASRREHYGWRERLGKREAVTPRPTIHRHGDDIGDDMVAASRRKA